MESFSEQGSAKQLAKQSGMVGISLDYCHCPCAAGLEFYCVSAGLHVAPQTM